MITIVVLAGMAVLVMAALLLAVRGQSGSVRTLQQLEGSTRPVDLRAFQNLTDPGEEQYLREQLSPEDFRAIHRERLKSALEYVERVAHNASLLLRVGEAERQNADAEIARAADELAEGTLRLRMYALLAEGLLHTRVLIPGMRWSPARVVADYEGLRERVARPCRLQVPEQAGRISAAL